MRTRLLSAIAAVATGTGAAWGQAPATNVPSAPPPPMPIGQLGGYPSVENSYPTAPTAMPGGPGMMPGGPGMMPGGPGFDPSQGMPGYPQGLHGQQAWEPPFAVNGGGSVLQSRIAPRAWVEAEYLLWFVQSQPTTYPFVTSGPPISGGILGNTGTVNLHSTSDLGYDLFSGYRITGGVFRGDDRRFGWYLSGFQMEEKANIYQRDSDRVGQPLLARPFISGLTNTQSSLLAAYPGFSSGGVAVISRTKTFGAEVGPMINLFRSSPDCPPGSTLWNINMLGGFRFLELDEDLFIQQTTTLLPGAAAPFSGIMVGEGSFISVDDKYETSNQFYGGQVGLQSEVRRNRWKFGLTGKIALGVMHERINVRGESRLLSPSIGAYSTVPGGLYATGANLGQFNNDEFAVLPEVSAKLGYAWTSWLSGSVGYNFLYVSRAARPGNLYSPIVNPAIVPTSSSFGVGPNLNTPIQTLTQSDFWLQGVSFELAIRY